MSAFFSVLTFGATFADLKATDPAGMTSRIPLRAMINCPPKTLRPDPNYRCNPATEIYVTGREDLLLVLSRTLHVSMCLAIA